MFVFTSVAIPKPLVRYTSLYAILSVALVNLLVRNIYVYIFLFSIVSLSQVKLHICELVLSEKKKELAGLENMFRIHTYLCHAGVLPFAPKGMVGNSRSPSLEPETACQPAKVLASRNWF